MYQAGDYIVYGTSGVCRVDEVKPSPFEDEADRQYYADARYGHRDHLYSGGLAGFHAPGHLEGAG